jgi:class 3 adenylate cyclase
VAKFSSQRFPPGFFDLPQGAGETLPVEIIDRWTRATQTAETARAILAPHTLRGVVVSSDSSGLTKLSRERVLVEILAMISRPKELVHAWGTAIGGRALGVWAADNTQMFYPPDVEAARLVGAMLSAVDQVTKECEISIGLCAHRGEFFVLGGGVYGPDADRVEVVAEDHTSGGELLITDTLADALATPGDFALAARDDLAREFGRILRVTTGPRVVDVTPSNFDYPAPFTTGFFEEISSYTRSGRASRMPRPEYDDAAVVLIEREREETDVPEVAVLNDLALSAAMKRIGAGLLADLDGTEIKTSGLISIFVFPQCAAAVTFAQGFRAALKEQGIDCRIGIDTGQVLLFELGAGARDIAGSPVNVASKLAQDVGEFGKIYVSDAAAKRAGITGDRQTFDVSGVRLGALVL